jgi:hypothetical protein
MVFCRLSARDFREATAAIRLVWTQSAPSDGNLQTVQYAFGAYAAQLIRIG